MWGTARTAAPDAAAWANGTGVRSLDFNDTYLSKEPCHPSDLLSSAWAAASLAPGRQARRLLDGLVVGYDVLCRLCDMASLRERGWDHVTYLPVASAVACAHVLGLPSEKAAHAIALAVTGSVALRQTRVGTLSDWKAACAAHAARAGLWGALLAARGVTGPSEVFGGRHGFFRQLFGRSYAFPSGGLGRPWRILGTHMKYFPAEHHAQSAIEAALRIRKRIDPARVASVRIRSFRVSVEIIGSEPEKWAPTTRETADHSLPYLVAAALLDGAVTVSQYRRRRYLDADVRALLKRVSVVEHRPFTRAYPAALPARVDIRLKDGRTVSETVMRPRGYAGNPMTEAETEAKFHALAAAHLPDAARRRLLDRLWSLERVSRLNDVVRLMRVGGRHR